MRKLNITGTKQIRGFDVKIGLIPETFEELLPYVKDNGATLEGAELEAELVKNSILQVLNHSLASNLQTKLARQLAKDKGFTIGKEDDKDYKDLSAMLKDHTLENNFSNFTRWQTSLCSKSDLKSRAQLLCCDHVSIVYCSGNTILSGT